MVLTNVGSQATSAANLWQIQELTDSTFFVGLVGLVEGVAIIGIAPLAGTVADRVDRRRLLTIAQLSALVTSLLLAALTITHTIAPGWIYVAATVTALAQVFDTPARQSLVPAVAPSGRLLEAYTLLAPLASISRLLGPAIAGLLIAIWGVAAVYLFDALTFGILIALISFHIKFAVIELAPPQAWRSSVAEGFRYVRGRPIVWQLMALDFVAVFFAGYRVVLPALARDVYGVGAAGYGLLAAVPAGGGLLGAALVYRLRGISRKGLLSLGATAVYGLCVASLGFAPSFLIATALVGICGFSDAVCQALRHAVVQLETPDSLRGRVTSIYGMSARGGSSIGQMQMGFLASLLTPPIALLVGGTVTTAYVAWLTLFRRTIRTYRGGTSEVAT